MVGHASWDFSRIYDKPTKYFDFVRVGYPCSVNSKSECWRGCSVTMGSDEVVMRSSLDNTPSEAVVGQDHDILGLIEVFSQENNTVIIEGHSVSKIPKEEDHRRVIDIDLVSVSTDGEVYGCRRAVSKVRVHVRWTQDLVRVLSRASSAANSFWRVVQPGWCLIQ
jgi:hypothetical protein